MPKRRASLVGESMNPLERKPDAGESGMSGLMSGEWKRSAWRAIQAPATERAGHRYGPT